MATFPQTVSYRDAKGQTSTMKFFVSAASAALALTAAEAIVVALTALTNAAQNNAKGAYTTSPTTNTYGTDATFATVEDKAMLTYQTSTGQNHRYMIPAPLAAIFLADTETVDTANTLVAALTTAAVGHMCSGDGVLIAGYVGGIRIRRKLKRKYNIYTLNPTETGPGE